MSEYKIDGQDWKSWPKAVMVRRDWTTNGHDHRREVRRYVPDDEATELQSEIRFLHGVVKSLERRFRRDAKAESRGSERVERLRGRVHEIARDRDMLNAENAKLRELCADLYAEMITYSKAPNYNASVWAPKLRELGVEVTE